MKLVQPFSSARVGVITPGCDLSQILQSESFSLQIRDSKGRGSAPMIGCLTALNSMIVKVLLPVNGRLTYFLLNFDVKHSITLPARPT